MQSLTDKIFQTGGDADIREQENSDIQNISADILAECNYQILKMKICNGGRVFYILTNFIPNISALKRKHFAY